jgi:hypothetical protein
MSLLSYNRAQLAAGNKLCVNCKFLKKANLTSFSNRLTTLLSSATKSTFVKI